MSEPPAESAQRPPFPFEDDSRLLRNLMVPDPLPLPRFQSAMASCPVHPPTCMASHLVHQSALSVSDYLHTLAKAFPFPVCPDPRFLPPESDDPPAALLRHHSFLPMDPACVRSTTTKRPLCGGPQLPPDLPALLGSAHSQWQWFLVPPPAIPSSPPEPRPSTPFHYSNSNREDWLRQLLTSLRARKASDIHFEAHDNAFTVRAHIDQHLLTVGTWHDSALLKAAFRILKQWCGFSTADNGLPQDGRLHLPDSKSTSYRASWIATHRGQSLVLRLPPALATPPPLSQLGFPHSLSQQLHAVARQQSGLLLFVGPTGSGKTTSAYSLLHGIAGQEDKLLTIEDPVERPLPNAVQCDVDIARNWTFDTAVRAFLRQDPDFIFIGELRDAPSANAAVRAAITGHTVIATLHAASSSAARQRLLAWDIPRGLVAESLQAIVHQRIHQGQLASVQPWFASTTS